MTNPTTQPPTDASEREEIAVIERASRPGGIDFSNWSYNTLPERTGNVGWQPDLQDLIYTAISHVEGDYEDADENCAEQVIERLVLAIKDLLIKGDALQSSRTAGMRGEVERLREALEAIEGDSTDPGARAIALAALNPEGQR